MFRYIFLFNFFPWTDEVLFCFTLACVVCFRWFAWRKGKEQENGRRDGSCFPGHSEHVKIEILFLPSVIWRQGHASALKFGLFNQYNFGFWSETQIIYFSGNKAKLLDTVKVAFTTMSPCLSFWYKGKWSYVMNNTTFAIRYIFCFFNEKACI